jgi:hypothetical protein
LVRRASCSAGAAPHRLARIIVEVQAEDKLRQSVKRDSDAVAFGYVGGKWFAAA